MLAWKLRRESKNKFKLQSNSEIQKHSLVQICIANHPRTISENVPHNSTAMKSENRRAKINPKERSRKKGAKTRSGTKKKNRVQPAGGKGTARRRRNATRALSLAHSLLSALPLFLSDDARPLATQLVSLWIPCGTHWNDEFLGWFLKLLPTFYFLSWDRLPV